MRMLLLVGRVLVGMWLLAGVAAALAAGKDDRVADVNGVAIRWLDVEVESYLIRSESRRANRPLSEARLSELRQPIVDTLIERELLFQAARKKKIDVAGRAVDLAFKELKRTRGSAVNALKQMGLSDAELKARVRKGLVVQRLLYLDVLRYITRSESEPGPRTATPPEGDGDPVQVRVRHILAAADSDDGRRAALERLQAVRRELDRGVPFALAAFDHSDCPSRNRGGDLGYLTYDELIPVFAEAVAALQPGMTSDVVATRLGYHLIQLVDRRSGWFEDGPQAERTLRFQKERDAIQAYVDRLEERADIRR